MKICYNIYNSNQRGQTMNILPKISDFDIYGVISDNLFNAIMGAGLLFGFSINWMIVKYVPNTFFLNWDIRILVSIYVIFCVLGSFLFTEYDNPFISLIGYAIVAFPFGFVLNVAVSKYSSDIVINAIYATCCVTVGMTIVGILFPNFFKNLSQSLTIALSYAVLTEIVQYFAFGIHTNIFDWIVVFLFCGYIGYHWSIIVDKEKTVNNAIDSAAELYVNIVGLLIRFIGLSSSTSRNKK